MSRVTPMRAASRYLLVVTVLVLGTYCAQSQLSTTSPWPLRGRNLQRTSLSNVIGPQNTSVVRVNVNLPDTSFAYGGISMSGAAESSLYFGQWAGPSKLYGVLLNGTVRFSPTVTTASSAYTGGVSVDNSGNIYITAISGDNTLSSFTSAGALRFRITLPYSAAQDSPLIDSRNFLMLGLTGGRVVCYNLNVPSNTTVWTYNLGNLNAVVHNTMALSFDQSLLYASFDMANRTVAINTTTGTAVWSVNLNGERPVGGTTLSFDGTVVYFTTFNGRLYAVNSLTGAQLWNLLVVDVGINGCSSPALGPDGTILVHFATNYAGVYPNGRLRFLVSLPGIVYHSTAAVGADGTSYFPVDINPGRLMALDLDGNTKFSYGFTGSNHYASPVIGSDGTLYTLSWLGQLVALGGVGAPPSCGNVTVMPYLDFTQTSLTSTTLSIMITASSTFTSVVAAFTTGNSTLCSSANPHLSLWVARYNTPCLNSLLLTGAVDFIMRTCSFNIDESNADTSIFTGTILVTTIGSNRSIRGLPVNTTTVTAIVVTVAYSTVLNATSGSLSITGTSITFAAITNQSLTITANPPFIILNLITSVQYPYQLYAPAIPAVTNFTASIVAITGESSFQANASVCNVTGSDLYQAGASCTQSWRVTIAPVASLCPIATTFNAAWSVNFAVRCHSSYGGACVNSTANAVSFSTSSDNLCPRLITNTAGATLNASVSTFQNAGFNTAQSSFVLGSRAFFQVVVISSIQMSHVNIERVTITSGAAAGVTDLYSKPFSSVAAGWFGSSGTVTGSFASSPVLFTLQDSNTNVPAFQHNASFSFVLTSDVSAATGDVSTGMSFLVAIRARYANVTTVGGTVKTALLHAKLNSNNVIVLSDSAATVVTRLNVQATTTQPPTAVSAASSGSSGFVGTGLIVSVGVGALISVVVVVVVLMKRKQRQQRSDKKSIELSSSSSSSHQETTEADNEMETTMSME